MFYAKRGRTGRKSKFSGKIYGFPMVKGQWCLGELKLPPIRKIPREAMQYLGIAADETVRIKRHSVRGFELPLVALGWTEADARLWCEKNNLLSPIYSKSTRGGCWFCHNQSVDQLRRLRKDHPDLWKLLLKWDKDSPVSFRADGHTVSDYDRRFFCEDIGLVPCDRKFRWKTLDGVSSNWLDTLLTLDS